MLIVRAGDFFGPHAPGSWLTGVMVKPGKTIRSVAYPGDWEVGHAWAYLPDLAETIARLVAREAELGRFQAFNFGGHYFARGVEMAEAVRRAAGVPDAQIRKVPWVLIRAAAPLVPLFRELTEMRYLWQVDLRLDNARLLGFLGDEPHTPIEVALRTTLAGLGCLAETG